MGLREVGHQRHIIQSFMRDGGMGWKMRLITGMPDLVLLHRDLGVIFAECKFIREMVNTAKLHVTPLQLERLRRINKRGGNGFILVVYTGKPETKAARARPEFRLVVLHWTAQQVSATDRYIVRGKDHYWPIVKELQREVPTCDPIKALSMSA